MNNKLPNLKCQLILFLYYAVYLTTAEENGSENHGIDILLLGSTGSGKSSTLNMIFDRVVTETNPKTNEVKPTKELMEYKIQDNDNVNNFIRFIDTPGLGSTKGVVHETRVLATIKKYLRENDNPPAIILIFSKFDDNRFSGEKSNFVQMLKKYNNLETWYNPPGKISPKFIFVFTHVQGVTIREQRNPKSKIKLFSDVIRNHTTFPSPILISLAENEAVDEELEYDDDSGSYELLNGDLYPKNLIDNILSALANEYNESEVEVYKTILENRKTFKVDSKKFMRVLSLEDIPNDDVEEELQEKLKPIQTSKVDPITPILPSTESSSSTTEATPSSTATEEISNNTELPVQKQNSTESLTIPEDYDSVVVDIDENLLSQLNPQKSEALQKILRSNIGVRRTKNEIVEFFHSLELNEENYEKLESLLKVKVPQLDLDDPVVGFGYNILKNIPLVNTPYENENFEFSSLGFKIPEIVKNTNLKVTAENLVMQYYPSLVEFLKIRLKNLNLENVEIDSKLFQPNLIAGNNIKQSWEDGDYIKITALREFKTFTWRLKENLNFNEEFLEILSELPPLSLTSRDSVTDWTSLFETYGTHVVTFGYGGGSVETHFHIDKSKVEELKSATENSTHSFISVPDYFQNTSRNPLVYKTEMRFNGGLYRKRMENLNNLSSQDAKSIYEAWIKSLSIEPVILENNLVLVPLSEAIKKQNPILSPEMKKAEDLFLSGKLIYTKYSPSTTIEPSTTTTTIPPLPKIETIKPTTIPTTQTTATTAATTISVAPTTIATTATTFKPTQNHTPHSQNQSTQFTKLKPQPDTTLNNICEKLKGNVNVVGHGYNIQHRVLIKKSPFESTAIEKFTTCHNNRPSNSNQRFNISFTYEVFGNVGAFKGYLTKYMKRVSSTENVSIGDKFICYYNKSYPPGMNSVNSSLIGRSWLEEYTIFSLELHPIDFSDLSTEFTDLVDSLPILDARSALRGRITREVSKEWTNFFDIYGTHVIKYANVGGALKITPNGEVWDNYRFQYYNKASQRNKENLLRRVTDRSRRELRFSAIGGNNSLIYNMGFVPEAIRHWQDSLFERPALLQSNLKLIPIVQLVKYVRPTLQKTADAVMKFVYDGSVETLQRVRKERNALGEPCDLDTWNSCYQNSRCMDNGSLSVCLCYKDFKDSNSGQCFLPYGSPCQFRLECNHESGVNCIYGYCECLIRKTFSRTDNSCLSRTGEECGHWIGEQERVWHYQKCRSGLMCSSQWGRCFKPILEKPNI